MDLLLLGAAAVVLVALTLWLVWRPGDVVPDEVRSEEAKEMLPQGDRFEDQYTSATADLSAGGVALAAAHDEPGLVDTSDVPGAGEPLSEPGLARDRVAAVATPRETVVRDSVTVEERRFEPATGTQRSLGIGAAALLTLGGAVGGAWLYSRWQKDRNKPINRLRRRFR